MKISISASSPAWDLDAFKEQLTYVQEAERMGADTVWTVEGWGQDAVTPCVPCGTDQNHKTGHRDHANHRQGTGYDRYDRNDPIVLIRR